MCDTMVMRILKRIRDLHNDLHKLSEIVAFTIVENFSQRIAMYEFHGEIRITARVARKLIGWHSIRMLQHCGYACLANEALLLDLIIREFRFECFVANKSREVQVFTRFDE